MNKQSAFLKQKRLFATTDRQRPLDPKAYYDYDNISYPTSYRYLLYPPAWTNELRDLIRARDFFQCQECGATNDDKENAYNNYAGVVLDVHHIDYSKHHLFHENLITLCHGCHSRTSSGRTAWRLKFEERIIEIYKAIKNGTHTRFSVLEVEVVPNFQIGLAI